MLPYFRKSEDYHADADDMHGTGGDTAHRRFNRGDNFGVGYFKVNQRSGWRWTTAKAFLRPAKSRRNLKVVTRAHAQKVVITDKRASGVQFLHKGAAASVLARREVILASGAIGTPQLLQLSGIGPGGLLQRLGVEVVHDAPGVGSNLQDHLQIRCAYKITGAKTLNVMTSSMWGKAKIGLEYALRRSGLMSMAPSQLGAFTYSDARVASPDLEYHVQPVTLEAFGQAPHDFPAITASVCHLRPESRGHVQITSADPMVHPEIQPNYLSTEGDRVVAANAIRQTRSIMCQPALARYQPQEFKPGPELQTEEELIEGARRIASTIFHHVGTARMGTDTEAVVDPRLRVNGVSNLRVVDASVMPNITSGNTNFPTVMIAERAADLILNRI